MKINKIIEGFCPPFFLKILQKLIHYFKNDKEMALFGGDEDLFKKLSQETKIYGEYGSGQSTIWMAKNTDALIISADTSPRWSKKIKALNSKHNMKVIYCVADCGEIIGWGYPLDYSKRDNFQDYFNSIWNKKNLKPDTILIDGRFRLACFFTCLLNSEPGTKIIFDDYVNRPHYHIVEEYLTPIDYCGRQALFVTPQKENKRYTLEQIKREVSNFKYVFN